MRGHDIAVGSQPEENGPRGTGTLVVSLDLEMLWGVEGILPVDGPYRANLEGTRAVVPALLDLFEEFGIHATWAVVGALMARDRLHLERLFSEAPPSCRQVGLDVCRRLDPVPGSLDHLRFAPDLVNRIAARAGQEIGSHTFSHRACLETDHGIEAFAADVDAALYVAAHAGHRVSAFVFPGNLSRPGCLAVLRDRGIKAYRGPQPGWAFRPGAHFRRPVRKVARFIADYGRVPGYSSREAIVRGGLPFNLRASGFWGARPRRACLLDGLRIRHVIAGMARAAMAGGVYHLWWHPHNFGAALEPNLKALRRVFWAWRRLRDSGKMRSRNMGELADELEAGSMA